MELVADADEEVGLPEAGRVESAASVVNTAFKPVTFLQSVEGVVEPATKLIAAHCGTILPYFPQKEPRTDNSPGKECHQAHPEPRQLHL